jgi:hypothetical protein
VGGFAPHTPQDPHDAGVMSTQVTSPMGKCNCRRRGNVVDVGQSEPRNLAGGQRPLGRRFSEHLYPVACVLQDDALRKALRMVDT